MEIKHKTVWGMTIPVAGALAGVAIAPKNAVAKSNDSRTTVNFMQPAASPATAEVRLQSLAAPNLTQQVQLKRRLVQGLPTDPMVPAPPMNPTSPTTPAMPTDPTSPVAPLPSLTSPSTPVSPASEPVTVPVPPASSTAAPTNYVYVGGILGGSQVDPFSVGRAGGDVRVENYRSAIYGAFVGYRMGDFRIEAEAHRTSAQLQRSSVANLTGNVQSNAYMVNGYWDVPITNQIKPFGGAGVGIMNANFKGNSPSLGSVEGSKSGLVYQLKAGISYSLDSKMDVFLQYRYLSTPRNSVGEGQINDFSSQSFEGGIRIGL